MENNSESEMRVVKRNGTVENMEFDKIVNRIKKLGQEANIQINYAALTIKVIDQLYDKIPTTKIDELTAQQCASLSTQHPDYGTLAGRIVVSNHQKNTDPLFSSVMQQMYEFKDNKGNPSPLLSHETWQHIQENQDALNGMIDHSRDYLIDYFGFKTLERAYLIRINNVVVERVQHMWLRVSVGIHGDRLDKVKETYDLMSQKYLIHATPTLFNSGTPHPQLSSCYLIAMESDSLDGIYETLKDCAKISKWSGGVGLHIHNIRAKQSLIRGTNGLSSGLVPMLKVYNDTARFVNQGGKRNGSFAIYLEPWHPDVEDFLEMRKNHGDEEMRARDLFYALWVPDLFMERVKDNSVWTYFCPNECPGLSDAYGSAFKVLYEKYEAEGLGRRQVQARDLWFKILDAQMETGTPYLLYKDAANEKNNQKNLGTIKSSNLCTEIMEYSDANETAVCNLASVSLPAFVTDQKTVDYEKLHAVVKVVTHNLNRIIDINFYPTEKTNRSNFNHRPIGIGVQGLADVFMMLDLPFASDRAKEINRLVSETMYHAALECSNEIAKERYENVKSRFGRNDRMVDPDYTEMVNEAVRVPEADRYKKRKKDPLDLTYTEILTLAHAPHGNNDEDIYMYEIPTQFGAYSSFIGSPASKGILQFDMWGVIPGEQRYDWAALKTSIQTYGLRNSLLLTMMPTASTSQILGNNECFEPLTSNIYSRSTLAGEFVVANKYLMSDLIQLGLWNEKVKNNIIANKGSIQQLTMVPPEIREKYKIVWEIPMKHLIDMSADRGAYIARAKV